jgi:hypothetical protein
MTFSTRIGTADKQKMLPFACRSIETVHTRTRRDHWTLFKPPVGRVVEVTLAITYIRIAQFQQTSRREKETSMGQHSEGLLKSLDWPVPKTPDLS